MAALSPPADALLDLLASPARVPLPRTCTLLAARLSPWGPLRAALMGAMLAAPPTLDPLAEGMAVLRANASALLQPPLESLDAEEPAPVDRCTHVALRQALCGGHGR